MRDASPRAALAGVCGLPVNPVGRLGAMVYGGDPKGYAILLFVKAHPFFKGLPVNCAMNWECQKLPLYDGPKHFGLLTEGEEALVGMVGVPLRGFATSVGIFDCGKGKIVFSSLDLAPNLASDAKPSVTPKKIFANMLRWAANTAK